MKKDSNFIIIVGCGRFGSAIAESYSEQRKSVVVIDKDPESFARLSDNFSGFTIESDANETDALVEANIEKAGIVLVATNNDNRNIMIALIAKDIYKVPKVIARIVNPNRAKIYHEFGIETICPIELSKVEFEKLVSASKKGDEC